MYYVDLINSLSNYKNLKKTGYLSKKDQLSLRCWYRSVMQKRIGWITYWVKLSHNDTKFFVKNMYCIVNFGSWRDLLTILNYDLKEEVNDQICQFICDVLTDDLLDNTSNSQLAASLPVDNKNIDAAYNKLLKYFRQSPKEWRLMITELRQEYVSSVKIFTQTDLSYELNIRKNNIHLYVKYSPILKDRYQIFCTQSNKVRILINNREDLNKMNSMVFYKEIESLQDVVEKLFFTQSF